MSAPRHSCTRQSTQRSRERALASYTFRSTTKHRMSEHAATYYDLLQVNRGTRPDDVRTAYRRLAQKFHPDKMQGNADAQRVMAALNEAYAVLSDPERRALYDRRMADAQLARQRAHLRMLAQLDDPGAAWPW